MKKIVPFTLSLTMIISLTACMSNKDEMNSTTEVETTVQSNMDKDGVTVGEKLLDFFHTEIKADPTVSAEKLAEDILSSSIIEFDGAQIPVENGLLTGFGNVEITGFKEGVMFSPMISTIPFVGYIFILDDDIDAAEFTQNLKNNADLRWNICTEADEMIADYSDKTVFFLMCPNSFESE